LNSNLSNLRFIYNGYFVPAWLESINNGTATIWIKMPVSIPANSSITLNLYSNSTLNFDGAYWGKAPQLSLIYGQYDNGASVFNNYWNFAGTSLPNGLNTFLNNGTIIINNSIKIIPPSNGETLVYSSTTLSTPAIAEALTISASDDVDIFFSETDITSTPSTGASIYNGYVAGFIGGTDQALSMWYFGGWHPLIRLSNTAFYPAIVSLIWGGTGNLEIMFSYGYISTSNDTTFSVGSNWLVGIGSYGHVSSPYATYQWLRTRAYPPNGIMPSVELM